LGKLGMKAPKLWKLPQWIPKLKAEALPLPATNAAAGFYWGSYLLNGAVRRRTIR
jgi:hypothetical protein